MTNRRSWQAGTLPSRLAAQTDYALATGALKPIATEYEFIEQAGVSFLVRILANLARKEAAKKVQQQREHKTGQTYNPFLPYEADLYVTDISETHLCLLNKFNVVDHHMLIITRDYEPQAAWLTLADFEALWKCMAEIDGFMFYNAGTTAGASQRHKHLQLVPLPMLAGLPTVPIETVLQTVSFKDGLGYAEPLPFVHAIAQLPDLTAIKHSADGGQCLLEIYQRLLETLNIHDPSYRWQGEQTVAYNLLGTRDWLMAVPRSQESFRTISVNSLGFAGSLLVKNAEKLNDLKTIGPMTLLEQVGISRGAR
ncbi:MAG: phosphorylase [Leptolyngbya sp. SIO4C1]|nr:phosphorylase [Leptolyngbya sp. SIO4C1]